MKVLVEYSPGAHLDRYIATRLRKNIKGALELVGTSWVESMFAEPDVVHLISPDDESLAHDAKEQGATLVVSALYSEGDPGARFMSVDGEGFHSLRPKAERLLKMADMVFVPSEAAETALLTSGLALRAIRVVTPGVNLARFDAHSDIEKIVFRRYFRLEEGAPYCLTVGEVDDDERLEAMAELASLVPGITFFYLLTSKKGPAKPSYLRRKSKHYPRNLILSGLVEDDVYRSGVVGALAYLSFASIGADELAVLEAMAAKTPVLSLGHPFWSEELTSSKAYRAYPSVERLAKAVESLAQGKGQPTIIEAYRLARKNSLAVLGRKLVSLYMEAIEGEQKGNP